ncbi:MAG: hypothetical protein A3G08_01265 [Candidatus Magasanikbacteria bacterium RIFCSPLOWO2_12_FULL_47_9b]|nr:MAG: hypothetical protein A3G08_01265 [Candidatus Magasanikbacteria bacterium RIFCSPLOWO2_12_FULL_47_9b]
MKKTKFFAVVSLFIFGGVLALPWPSRAFQVKDPACVNAIAESGSIALCQKNTLFHESTNINITLRSFTSAGAFVMLGGASDPWLKLPFNTKESTTSLTNGSSLFITYVGIFQGNKAVFQINATGPESTAELIVVKDTSLGSKTLLPASAAQTVGQFLLKAPASNKEVVCLSSLGVSFDTSFETDETILLALQNMSVSIGGEPFGTTYSNVSVSQNIFIGSSCFSPGESAVAKVVADISVSVSPMSFTTVIDAFGFSGSISQELQQNDGDVLGQFMTIGSVNLVIQATNDASTASKILLPGASQQVGKWKVQTQNGSVTMNTITFQVRDENGANDEFAGNFGTLMLYDALDMNTPIGTGSYIPGIGNGFVQFSGMAWQIPGGDIRYLVLKADINGSGTMDPASINVFVVRSDSAFDIVSFDQTGAQLSPIQIDDTAGGDTFSESFATSTYYLFHNAAPVITTINENPNLEISSQAKLFTFKITNNGDREMRLRFLTVTLQSIGMSPSGTIQHWQLWEANSVGGFGTLLAVTDDCPLAGSGVPTWCSKSQFANVVDVYFGTNNDMNDLFENFIIAQGSSRTFIVVADTSNALNGKTSGFVDVFSRIDGDAGFQSGNASFEKNWTDGNVGYSYIPIGGDENLLPYTASDSYPVVGNTLKVTL